MGGWIKSRRRNGWTQCWFVGERGKEEMDHMVETLQMCKFASRQEATTWAGKLLTTTKWVDSTKKTEEWFKFARCRLVARDFKRWHERPRDDLYAATAPLESNVALFADFAGIRRTRRNRGEPEVKLMFVDVRKPHLIARCGED